MDSAMTTFGLAVLTISTSGYLGQRKEDASGKAIQEMLAPPEYQPVRYEIVFDDKNVIRDRLSQWADADDVDLIICTGGTGLGVKDYTPEVCLSVIDKEVPGIAEAMRARTMQFTPMAMISRSVAGIRGKTLIITLPGSPKAVCQCLEVVKPVLPHALQLLRDEAGPVHPV